MRLKLDESLGRRAENSLRSAGHDVDTVHDENLAGADDDQVFDAAVAGRRALVALDVDFADPLRFPPAASSGIIVLRLGEGQPATDLGRCLDRLVSLLADRSPEGELWIVEPGRLRKYEPPPA